MYVQLPSGGSSIESGVDERFERLEHGRIGLQPRQHICEDRQRSARAGQLILDCKILETHDPTCTAVLSGNVQHLARTAAKLRSACRTPSTRQHVGARVFPKFEQGMSTAEYVAAFETLNQNAYGEVNALPYNLTNYLAPCTLYEGGALDFDAIEEPIDAPERTEPEPTRTPEPMVQIVSSLTGAYLGLLPKSAAHAMAQRHGNTIGTPAPADYTITAARYSKTGTMVIKTHSPDGYSTRASRLAATFGRYSHRQGGYTVTAKAAARFSAMYAAGWDGSYISDKAADRKPPAANQTAEAARQVSELIASATTAAAIEQASEATEPEHLAEATDAGELATVEAAPESMAATCDASSAGNQGNAPTHGHASSRPHQAPPKPTHDAHGQRIGQRVAGNSGHWRAVMFTDPDGRPSFEFDGPGGLIEVLTFTTGRERMAALQAMAREADDAADQSNDASDADQPPAEQAGIESIKDAIRMNEREMERVLKSKQKGSKESAYRIELIISELADKLSDALKASKSTTTTGEYQQPAPVPKTETEARTTAADKVPRAVGADSGPASNPPGATAPSAPAPSAPAPSAPAPDTEASADEPEPEFTRTAPQPFDMLAMIAAGVAPADFVGLGIVYSGDRANASGRGAITNVQPCSWYKYTVTVTLEDGRQSRLNPVSFTDHLGNRYKTDFKRHGAPYLAELAAARLAVEAADKAAKQAAADDKARQLRELPQQWPQLKAYDPAGKLNGPTLAAHNIRVLLKEQFPKVKFSVKSDRYSGGDAIDIRWTDGPNTKAVEKIADQFEAGHFNGQEDIYEYAHSVFRDLFGDAKYIHCHRDISDALLSKAIAAEYPGTESRPTVEDYRKAQGVFSYQHRDEWHARRIRERLETMGAGLPS